MRKVALLGTEYCESSTNDFEAVLHPQLSAGHDVLEIDVFDEEGLYARHFICKKEQSWDTYHTRTIYIDSYRSAPEGTWSKYTLEPLLCKNTVYIYGYGRKTSKESDKVIRKYFSEHSEYVNVISLVGNFVREIKWDKKDKAYERRLNRVDNAMNAVELIEDKPEYKAWIESLFPERYLFVESHTTQRGTRCRCTACGRTYFDMKPPRALSVTECKKCKAAVITKRRTETVEKTVNVMVVMRYSESELVLRHFKYKHADFVGWSQRDPSAKVGSYTKVTERFRLIVGKKPCKYYYGQRDGDELTQEWWDSKGNAPALDKKFMMCPLFLDDVPFMDKALLTTLKAGANAGVELDYNILVRSFETKPYLEYLIKGRYYKLAKEIIQNYGYWSDSKMLNERGRTVPELLDLEPADAYRLRDDNLGIFALKAMQYAEAEEQKVTRDTLMFIDGHGIDYDSLAMDRTGLNLNRAAGFIKRQSERNGLSPASIIQFYTDYLNMAEGRGMDITDDIIRLSPRMVEFHHMYLEEYNRKKDEKAAKEREKKFPNIRKDRRLNNKLFGLKMKEYTVMVPSCCADIVAEGRAQHHCVAASDTYFRKMNNRETFILFLRRNENKELPYYTLEIKLKGSRVEIIQEYAAYDRQPDKKKVDAVLAEWKKEVKKRIEVMNKAEKEQKEEQRQQALAAVV